VAAVVPVTTTVACPAAVAADHYLALLASPLVSDKYTAAKALAYFVGGAVRDALRAVAADDRQHVYVRLEAAASLVRTGDVEQIASIEAAARAAPVEERLESVIILGELASERAERTLIAVLDDPAQDPEIRGGAAWALGEVKRPSSVDALVRAFGQIEEPVRSEAVKALRKIAAETDADILAPFAAAPDDARAGIAWAASRSGIADAARLRAVMVDDDARRWVAYVLGVQSPDRVVGAVEALRGGDPEVYFATTVLWKIFASWINDVEEY
jgi:HEAT repeat protein